MTTAQVTALDLQTHAYQARSIINSTPLGTMVRPASNKLSVVSPMDFKLLGKTGMLDVNATGVTKVVW